MLSWVKPCAASNPRMSTIIVSGLGRRPFLAADLGEELALRRGQALDAAGADLVEHPIHLGVRARIGIAARFGALRGWGYAAAPADARRLGDEHTFRRPALPLLATCGVPILTFEVHQPRR